MKEKEVLEIIDEMAKLRDRFMLRIQEAVKDIEKNTEGLVDMQGKVGEVDERISLLEKKVDKYW